VASQVAIRVLIKYHKFYKKIGNQSIFAIRVLIKYHKFYKKIGNQSILLCSM
jgi:hypothetical protein